MKNKLISVVVTAYNTENYIRECIESIINQTYMNLEIILVDNGSTDTTGQIMDFYGLSEKRVRVIHKPHGTIYSGRKAGVMAATGDYLGFVDSDDYADIDLFQKLVSCSEGYDIVVSNHKRITSTGTYITNNLLPVGEYSSTERLSYLYNNLVVPPFMQTVGIVGTVWDKLFKTKLIQTVCEEIMECGFPDDAAIFYSCVLRSESVFVSDICAYNYRVNETSTTQSIYTNYLKDLTTFYTVMEEQISRHSHQKVIMPQMQLFVSDWLLAAGRFLGFSSKSRTKNYIFPFINMLENQYIALYGSGKVGCDYYYQIQNQNMCIVNLWVSKNWQKGRKKGLDTVPVERLMTEKYQYIVIAVERQDMAEEIREELINMGIHSEMILWKPPIYTVGL